MGHAPSASCGTQVQAISPASVTRLSWTASTQQSPSKAGEPLLPLHPPASLGPKNHPARALREKRHRAHSPLRLWALPRSHTAWTAQWFLGELFTRRCLDSAPTSAASPGVTVKLTNAKGRRRKKNPTQTHVFIDFNITKGSNFFQLTSCKFFSIHQQENGLVT